MLPPHSHFVSPRTKRRTMGAPESGRSNARSAPRSGRWALLRMRNAKPAAKESCLYDHALTSISRARSCSAGWVEGSCEVRRSQMAAVALRSRALRGDACMPKRSISAASRFGRSDSNADDIDAYPGALCGGRSAGRCAMHHSPFATRRASLSRISSPLIWSTATG